MITRKNQGGGLQTYLNKTVLENFEPNLYFYSMGSKPIAQSGYNAISWARFSTIDEDDITEGAEDGTDDGVTPEPIAITASVVDAKPKQYRGVVSLADLVIELNVLSFLEGAVKELTNAMARRIDKVIQSTLLATNPVGNFLYGGDATTLDTLADGDDMKVALLNKSKAVLDARSAPTYDASYYVAVSHPYAMYDLRAETGAGSWLEVSKYAKPEQLMRGEIGALNGVRMVMSPFSLVETNAGGVKVYNTFVFGKGAYGVADFQNTKTYITPNTPSDSDPLVQRRKVGVKLAFATKILQPNAMLVIRTTSSLTLTA